MPQREEPQITQMNQMGRKAAMPNSEAANFQHPIRVIFGSNIREIRGQRWNHSRCGTPARVARTGSSRQPPSAGRFTRKLPRHIAVEMSAT